MLAPQFPAGWFSSWVSIAPNLRDRPALGSWGSCASAVGEVQEALGFGAQCWASVGPASHSCIFGAGSPLRDQLLSHRPLFFVATCRKFGNTKAPWERWIGSLKYLYNPAQGPTTTALTQRLRARLAGICVNSADEPFIQRLADGLCASSTLRNTQGRQSCS